MYPSGVGQRRVERCELGHAKVSSLQSLDMLRVAQNTFGGGQTSPRTAVMRTSTARFGRHMGRKGGGADLRKGYSGALLGPFIERMGGLEVCSLQPINALCVTSHG